MNLNGLQIANTSLQRTVNVYGIRPGCRVHGHDSSPRDVFAIGFERMDSNAFSIGGRWDGQV
jgi:hypothetical protein